MKSRTTNIGINRALLAILAVIPLFFLKPFYHHFHVYLTGTAVIGIVKQQWHLVVISIVVFGLFLVPLTYRKRARWVDYGLVGAFFVSLFIEMFGIPLTVLFASKFLFVPGTQMPEHVVTFAFMGVSLGMDHAMTYGLVVMLAGMGLIVAGWVSLYTQVRQPGFARRGIYRYSRHPQYLGFVMLVIGWFIGWPTILTVIFSPILVAKYIRAARSEEADMLELYGQPYGEYMQETPFLV